MIPIAALLPIPHQLRTQDAEETESADAGCINNNADGEYSTKRRGSAPTAACHVAFSLFVVLLRVVATVAACI